MHGYNRKYWSHENPPACLLEMVELESWLWRLGFWILQWVFRGECVARSVGMRGVCCEICRSAGSVLRDVCGRDQWLVIICQRVLSVRPSLASPRVLSLVSLSPSILSYLWLVTRSPPPLITVLFSLLLMMMIPACSASPIQAVLHPVSTTLARLCLPAKRPTENCRRSLGSCIK